MKILPLINEDDPPSKKKQPSVWQRSWTMRLLKNPYAPIIVTFLGFLLAIACLYTFVKAEKWWLKEKIVAVPAIGIHTAKAAEMTTTERKIRQAFGVHAETFLKIAMAESGQQSGNKGYNCYYGKQSMACKPEDRSKAWSVDCGLLMVNVMGTICPAEMFDIDYNIKAAQGKFERQGFAAWTVCRKKVVCK